jgi:hypothetical protein
MTFPRLRDTNPTIGFYCHATGREFRLLLALMYRARRYPRFVVRTVTAM